MRLKAPVICITVVSLVATTSLFLINASAKKPALPPPAHELAWLADEITGCGDFYRGPEADPLGRDIAYTRSGHDGRRLCLLDVKTGTERVFDHTNTIFRLSSYSPDGNYLLFKDVNKGAERLCSYERGNTTLAVNRLVLGGIHPYNNATWLDTNLFCINYRGVGKVGVHVTELTANRPDTRKIVLPEPLLLVCSMGRRKAALVAGNNIWTLDVESGICEQLSHFPLAFSPESRPGHSGIEWLHFSPHTREFLFCCYNGEGCRHLFRWRSSGDSPLQQLTFDREHTYNGKWIQNGKGFAYIGSTNNHWYLAVRPCVPHRNTNLFTTGHIQTFTVSSDGDRLYAIASTAYEPPGIWEYDIATCALRYVGGGGSQWCRTNAITIEERLIQGADGALIPCYLVPPRRLDANKRYPAVIMVAPDQAQFHATWEAYSQFFANVGVFSVLVNPRGTDGYGEEYKAAKDKCTRDVLEVYEATKRIPSVDRKRISLMGTSSGGARVSRADFEDPSVGADLIIISGYPPPKDIKVLKNRRLFVFVGKGDRDRELVRAVQDFEHWAADQRLAVQTMYDEETRHVIGDIDVDKALMLRLSDFIFNR